MLMDSACTLSSNFGVPDGRTNFISGVVSSRRLGDSAPNDRRMRERYERMAEEKRQRRAEERSSGGTRYGLAVLLHEGSNSMHNERNIAGCVIRDGCRSWMVWCTIRHLTKAETVAM